MQVVDREELDWIVDKCEEIKETGYAIPDGYWISVRLLKCPDERYAIYEVTEYADGAVDEDAEVFTDFNSAVRAFKAKVLAMIDEVKDMLCGEITQEAREQLEHDLEEMERVVIET